jgi:hypothetical protein
LEAVIIFKFLSRLCVFLLSALTITACGSGSGSSTDDTVQHCSADTSYNYALVDGVYDNYFITSLGCDTGSVEPVYVKVYQPFGALLTTHSSVDNEFVETYSQPDYSYVYFYETQADLDVRRYYKEILIRDSQSRIEYFSCTPLDEGFESNYQDCSLVSTVTYEPWEDEYRSSVDTLDSLEISAQQQLGIEGSTYRYNQF